MTANNPVGWIGHNATTANPGKPAYLENAHAFLDQPGEWYLDRKTGVLTYIAPPDTDPNRQTFIAPRTEKLIAVTGKKGSPVRNIIFKGLTLEYVAWPLPAFGYSGIQAGHFGPDYKKHTYVLPDAVHFIFAEACRLENCRLQHTGASGIGFGAGCRHNKVTGCQIVDIGGNGVLVGWRDHGPNAGLAGDHDLAADWKDPKDAPLANEISNNVIQRCAAVNYGCVAVWDGFSAKTQITHNLVSDHPPTPASPSASVGTKPPPASANASSHTTTSTT